MSLRLNETAPDFTAETTQGTISFHEWIGDKWAILFSHPRISPRSARPSSAIWRRSNPSSPSAGAKLIGLSVDPSEAHGRWLADIEETQGAKVNYPIIADHDLKVAKLYNMLAAEEPGTSEGRTAATNQAVRTVYVIGPDKKIKLLLAYPMTTGRNFDEILRVLDSMQLTGQAQGRDASELEARRRRHHCGLSQRRRRQDAVPRRLALAEALHPHRQAAGLSLTAPCCARGASKRQHHACGGIEDIRIAGGAIGRVLTTRAVRLSLSIRLCRARRRRLIALPWRE